MMAGAERYSRPCTHGTRTRSEALRGLNANSFGQQLALNTPAAKAHDDGPSPAMSMSTTLRRAEMQPVKRYNGLCTPSLTPPLPLPSENEEPPLLSENEETSPRLCFCGRDEYEDEDGFWVQCDECDRWVHGSCTGMRSEARAKGRLYRCLSCVQDERAAKLARKDTARAKAVRGVMDWLIKRLMREASASTSRVQHVAFVLRDCIDKVEQAERMQAKTLSAACWKVMVTKQLRAESGM